jgi:hypothetical protein
MPATDLVGINGITAVLLVYTCQQGVYPRGHVLSLRLFCLLAGLPNSLSRGGRQTKIWYALYMCKVVSV